MNKSVDLDIEQGAVVKITFIDKMEVIARIIKTQPPDNILVDLLHDGLDEHYMIHRNEIYRIEVIEEKENELLWENKSLLRSVRSS